MVLSSRNIPWAAGSNDPNPWVELELSDRSTITGKNVKMTRFQICFCLIYFNEARLLKGFVDNKKHNKHHQIYPFKCFTWLNVSVFCVK